MSNLAIAAHHEAGHAVATLALGGWVSEVLVKPGGLLAGPSGYTTPEGVTGGPRTGALVLAAGEAAGDEYVRRAGLTSGYAYGCGPDREWLDNARHSGWAAWDRPSRKDLVRQALTLIRPHWTALERLAARLERTGRITNIRNIRSL